MTQLNDEDRRGLRSEGRIVFTSGGSTGEPTFSELNLNEVLLNCAWHGRGYRRAGILPSDTVAVWGVPGIMTSEFTVYLGAHETGARVLPIGVGLDSEKVFELLERFSATVLLVMPSNLHNVVAYCSKNKKVLSEVRLCVTGGEPMSALDRERLDAVCEKRVDFRQVYQTSEVGTIGYQCGLSEPGTFHVHEGYQTVEIKEPDRFGIGELLVTNHGRTRAPIVRFEVGDRAEIVIAACKCDDPAVRIKLHGRVGKFVKIGGEKVDYNRLIELKDDVGVSGDDFRITLDRDESGRDRITVYSDAIFDDAAVASRVEGLLAEVHPKMAMMLSQGAVAPTVLAKFSGRFLGNSGKTKYFEDTRSF